MAPAASKQRLSLLHATIQLWLCGLLLVGNAWGLAAKVSLKPRPSTTKQEGAGSRGSRITVDVSLVLVNVTVSDSMDRIITGLRKEHFLVKEDKVEQEIAYFGAEDVPVSVGILFDASGSIGEKMVQCRAAVAQFLRVANPQDEFFLILFNSGTELAVPFTRNHEDILNHITFTRSKGRTALLDAIYLGLSNMKEAVHTKKALLIFSDGGDNSSRYNLRDVKRLVRESDVQIYALGMFESIYSRGRTPEELGGPSLLSDLAEHTGGRHFPIGNPSELPDVAAKIGLELRNQYVLGYIPTNRERDGKWRRISVKVKKLRGMPSLRPYWRRGYYGR